MELKDAVIVVTGGGRGLGLAIVTHLVEQGARVSVMDRDEASVGDLPFGVCGHVADVTKPEDARSTVDEICRRDGRIDALVNNAGVIYNEPLVNILNGDGMMHDYGRFRDMVAANMDSVFIMTSCVVECMVKSRTKGAIVNISSISAQGNEGQTAYAAAKAGVNAMTVTWAKELGRFGIRCNAVAPGFTGTDSTYAALSESAIAHVTQNTPLRRLGEPFEVAHAVTAVLTNEFINGAVLKVDGGLTI